METITELQKEQIAHLTHDLEINEITEKAFKNEVKATTGENLHLNQLREYLNNIDEETYLNYNQIV